MTIHEQPNILEDFASVNKKKSVFTKPQIFFLITATLILIIPIFFWNQSVLIVFDRPRVFISGDVLIYLISAILIFKWTVYKFTIKLLLSKYLSWVHVGITLGILFYFLVTSPWFLKSQASNKTEYFINKVLIRNQERELRVNSILGIAFIMGQLVFLFNLIGGVIGRKHKNGT